MMAGPAYGPLETGRFSKCDCQKNKKQNCQDNNLNHLTYPQYFFNRLASRSSIPSLSENSKELLNFTSLVPLSWLSKE